MLRLLLCFMLMATLVSASTEEQADIVILSGSEAGFTAAIQAARMGKSVALIEPTGHPGGMAVEGIAGDIKHSNAQALGGIVREFYRGLAKHYGRPDPFSLEKWRPAYEPSIASKVIENMLAEYPEITVYRKQRLREGPAGVEKEGTHIKAVILEEGTRIAGKVFIDASIEGHLLHFAGVTTATGRESTDTYNEKLNGIQAESAHRQFIVPVDPYIEPGNPASGLIATIQPGELGTPGAADPHVMGFCFRLCLTNKPELIVPIEKPENYQPESYEIYHRYFAAGGDLFRPESRLPNGKTDLGSWHDLSANLYGENVGYSAGTYAEQDRIVKHHEDFTRGLIWFLQNDPNVPASQRKKWKGWGLCRDEFTDNNHWPRRLYIRCARRLVSDYVHTEHHTRWPNPEAVEDAVALAWWPPDMHHARRIVRDGVAYNEGFVYGDGGWSPFGVSYRALVPKRDEATNLITPTCPSSSYVSYSAIRILCTFMMLGQSAGTAAAIAADEAVAMQDLPYDQLRERLLADGMILEIPKGAEWDGKRDIRYGKSGAKQISNAPSKNSFQIGSQRCTGDFTIDQIPDDLFSEKAQIWTVPRGSRDKPWVFDIGGETDQEVLVLVMNRGQPSIPEGWQRIDQKMIRWTTSDAKTFEDHLYRAVAVKGRLEIPTHNGESKDGWKGVPHAVVVN